MLYVNFPRSFWDIVCPMEFLPLTSNKIVRLYFIKYRFGSYDVYINMDKITEIENTSFNIVAFFSA